MTTAQATGVMIFGALVAAAGVLLLVFTRTPGASRIRALGVEFELSTPALVVFLGGCALIVAPFLIGLKEERDGGSGSSGDIAVIGASRTCRGGDRFALSILKSKIADGVRTVPVRLQNASRDKSATVAGSLLTVADQRGAQIEPLHIDWSPPFQLDPTNFYEGAIELELNPERPLERITVRTTPYPTCPSLAAQTRL